MGLQIFVQWPKKVHDICCMLGVCVCVENKPTSSPCSTRWGVQSLLAGETGQ